MKITRLMLVFLVFGLLAMPIYAASDDEDDTGFFGKIIRNIGSFFTETIPNFINNIGATVDKTVNFITGNGYRSTDDVTQSNRPPATSSDGRNLEDDYNTGSLKKGDSFSYSLPRTDNGESGTLDVKVEGVSYDVIELNIDEGDVQWYDVDVLDIISRCPVCTTSEDTAGFVYAYDISLVNRGNWQADNVDIRLCVDEPAGKYCISANDLYLPPAEYTFTLQFTDRPLGWIPGERKFSEDVLNFGSVEDKFPVTVTVEISNDNDIVGLGYRNVERTIRVCKTVSTSLGSFQKCENKLEQYTLWFCPSGKQISTNDPDLCVESIDPIADDTKTEEFMIKKIEPQIAGKAGIKFG